MVRFVGSKAVLGAEKKARIKNLILIPWYFSLKPGNCTDCAVLKWKQLNRID
jgi:hypothetical protein